MKTNLLIAFVLSITLYVVFYYIGWKEAVNNIIVECNIKVENHGFVDTSEGPIVDHIYNKTDGNIEYITCVPKFKSTYRLDDTKQGLVVNRFRF